MKTSVLHNRLWYTRSVAWKVCGMRFIKGILANKKFI